MIVFSHTITPRLQYIFDFIGKEIIGKPFQAEMMLRLFDNTQDQRSITVMKELQNRNSELRILNCCLKMEIREQIIECFEANDYKAFFKTEGDFPFDIFAASFYLISRYEEYLPHKKDIYGRYAHENSLAFKEGFLHLPLINIWMEDFKKRLQVKFPTLTTHHSPFTFLPTYDIDEAYSYKYKEWWRTMGGSDEVRSERRMAND